jgi:hypothetical protein
MHNPADEIHLRHAQARRLGEPRRPANAPSSTATRTWSGTASWRHPQSWDYPGKNRELPMGDRGRALRAGEPVILSGSEIFGALFHAGQPTEGWRHGEVNAVKRWLLDQRDRLTDVDEPQ